jgi:hypothetical protein
MDAKPEPTKEELHAARPGDFDTEALSFVGMRGDSRRHLSREALEAALLALPAAARDEGRVDLLVARGPAGERQLHDAALLTAAGGMPADRWFGNGRFGVDYQLATTRTDVARLIANGQPLELHGDNLFLSLDVSTENLPVGTLLQLGAARLRVTPVPHNGCKKWVQRFGLNPMQLNLDPRFRSLRLRGLYLQVVEDGLVRVGDSVRVLSRAPLSA